MTLGTLVIDVDRRELSVVFLDDQAQVSDVFKMTKAGGNPTPVPDLVVISPGVSSSTLVAGEPFTVSATVENRGDAPADATTLRYYLSTDASISGSDTPLGSDAVSALDPAATQALSEDAAVPEPPGTYWVGACVDAVAGEVAVSDQCSTGVQVTVEASNVLFADGFESGDASAWQKVVD